MNLFDKIEILYKAIDAIIEANAETEIDGHFFVNSENSVVSKLRSEINRIENLKVEINVKDNVIPGNVRFVYNMWYLSYNNGKIVPFRKIYELIHYANTKSITILNRDSIVESERSKLIY